MVQPPGCITPSMEHLVCKLKRFLYRLKQSPQAWYSRINSNIRHKGMIRMHVDSNVYFFYAQSKIVILALYVDDLLITGLYPDYIADLKQALQTQYEITNLGLLRKFLGIQFHQTEQGLLLHQMDYAQTIIHDHSLPSLKPISVPLSKQ